MAVSTYREEHIGGQWLILGDCLEVLPTLEAGSVDLLASDPPYNVPQSSDYSWPDSNRGTIKPVFDTSWNTVGMDWIAATRHLYAPRGAAIVFCRLETIGEVCDLCVGVGLTVKQSMVWMRTTPIPRGRRPLYQSAAEGLVWAGRPGRYFDAPPDGRERWNVIEGPGNRANKDQRSEHPCPKPLWIMQTLLRRHCPPGGSILDPFMGTGTTLVAAEQLGRRGIGIEISPEYFEVACRRVAQAAAQPRLFAPDAPRPAEQQTILFDETTHQTEA